MLDVSTVPVALLAGGLATRLRPITETIPKALVDIDGRPFIDHQMDLLRRNGIRRVVMVTGDPGSTSRPEYVLVTTLYIEWAYPYLISF